jgi:hypothetical protein
MSASSLVLKRLRSKDMPRSLPCFKRKRRCTLRRLTTTFQTDNALIVDYDYFQLLLSLCLVISRSSPFVTKSQSKSSMYSLLFLNDIHWHRCLSSACCLSTGKDLSDDRGPSLSLFLKWSISSRMFSRTLLGTLGRGLHVFRSLWLSKNNV